MSCCVDIRTASGHAVPQSWTGGPSAHISSSTGQIHPCRRSAITSGTERGKPAADRTPSHQRQIATSALFFSRSSRRQAKCCTSCCLGGGSVKLGWRRAALVASRRVDQQQPNCEPHLTVDAQPRAATSLCTRASESVRRPLVREDRRWTLSVSSVERQAAGCSASVLSPLPSSSVTQVRHLQRSTRRAAGRRTRLVACSTQYNDVAVQAESEDVPGNGAPAQGSITKGAVVRVKAPLVVYHVPKQPSLNLEGMEGKVVDIVDMWKGQHLSANLPYKVAFEQDLGGTGKATKFFAHFTEDEIAVVSQAEA
ncbi:hypothetical protein CBR_g32063 [Chara braunii]|uniref:Ferredoxin thioredoxin reductase alpha chain domain-containing protein n=1 Tax=Chara braunii TaxID=69332 RepID=A0A388LGG1_CHABU|nr:hypothetical protein CBR_g32063 [Chara braunii]|eukprot:GBG81389.1 hypothetical protein CBR_g32063 [Chara braunii]